MKILCVLYDDPNTGMPERYARDDLPKLDKYPDGMSLPSPKAIDFTPGELLGCVSGELGLRKFLESFLKIFVISFIFIKPLYVFSYYGDCLTHEMLSLQR